MVKPRMMALIAIVLAAVASRLIPHPPNMTSITAIALFGGAYFSDKRLAFSVPLFALLLSDYIMGFYSHMEVVYLSFALIVCIGLWLQKRRRVVFITFAALASSVLFFVLTNLGVWALETIYPKTIAGLLACFVAGVPFFQNTLQGDLFFTIVLFGGFALLERNFPRLSEPSTIATALSV